MRLVVTAGATGVLTSGCGRRSDGEMSNRETSYWDKHDALAPRSAFQRHWNTPTRFPLCPASGGGDSALAAYLADLKPGAIFTTNQYGNTKVLAADWCCCEWGCLSVLSADPSPIHRAGQAFIYIEDGRFCHHAGRVFLDEGEALMWHRRATTGEALPEDAALPWLEGEPPAAIGPGLKGWA